MEQCCNHARHLIISRGVQQVNTNIVDRDVTSSDEDDRDRDEYEDVEPYIRCQDCTRVGLRHSFLLPSLCISYFSQNNRLQYLSVRFILLYLLVYFEQNRLYYSYFCYFVIKLGAERM